MKRVTTAAIVGIGLWGTAVFAPAIRAQGTVQETPAPGTLTNASLKTMLDQLGFEPQTVIDGYVVTIKRDGWVDVIRLGLSSDQTKLGFLANLGTVPSPGAVSAARWKKLLEDNFAINPSFISLDPAANRLFMTRVLDNHAITPAYFRRQIDNFCTNIHGTASDWQFK